MNNFGWLYFSDKHKDKMLNLLKGEDTVDELGLRRIQALISDFLFPYTTTIENRAKYLVLLPYIFRDILLNHDNSNGIKIELRIKENIFINSFYKLEKNDTNDSRYFGSSGFASKKRAYQENNAVEIIDRYPSTVYWASLKKLGIIMQNDSNSLHSFLLEIEKINKESISFERNLFESTGDDDNCDDDDISCESLLREKVKEFFPNLPEYDFSRKASKETLKLSYDEAKYIKERFVEKAPDSLFVYLIIHEDVILPDNVDDLFESLVDKKDFSSDLMKKTLEISVWLNKVMKIINCGYNFALINVINLNSIEQEIITEWNNFLGDPKWTEKYQKEEVKSLFQDLEKYTDSEKVNGANESLNFMYRFLDIVNDKNLNNETKNKKLFDLFKDREWKLKGMKSHFNINKNLNKTIFESRIGIDSFGYRYLRPAKTFIEDIREGLKND